MKRVCITILLILIGFFQLYAPNLNKETEQRKNEEKQRIIKLNEVLDRYSEYHNLINFTPYDKQSSLKAIHRIFLIESIAKVETALSLVEYNKLTPKERVLKAYNSKEEAVGLLQIRPIMYTHLNKELKLCNFKLADRWDGEKSIQMFIVFQDYYNPKWQIEKASRDWNGGGDRGMVKNATINYHKLVHREYCKLMKQIES